MSIFKSPFADTNLKKGSGCSCGKHASQGAHEAAVAADARVVAGAGDEMSAVTLGAVAAQVRGLLMNGLSSAVAGVPWSA